MAKKIKKQQPMTTAQQLSSIIKSCRDIMRKDKGLNGDLDRLPMLTWVMFLKFLDDMELIRAEEASLTGKRYKTIIESPYRWRDWAAKEDGITGDDLIAFINNDEAKGPDGKRGAGLFAYLRSMQGKNGGDRRDVIATVFRGLNNRMLNGYLLRDILNKINGIHFTSSDEIHTIGYLYESMLKEMRDSAGDSGEFYTPRAVVKFMVKVINPQLSETILDPACGTGGFLVETFEHLKAQCKRTEDFRKLQEESVYGIEAKSLPYLLCQMNLMLHGLEYPQIDPLNALRFPLNEIGDKDRVDILLTNPPFGGEEEKGIQNNFPDDRRTSETALLFLQMIMRKLRRPVGDKKPGRCGIIVPNGTLYATGIAARIREHLLNNFNLHTVIRLPKGVFEPYADIPTNILFFDAGKPTEFVWFYEHPLPPHRADMRAPSYSKSDPLTYEEFMPILKWWKNRTENEYAWSVSIKQLQESKWNLDQKNPRAIDYNLPTLTELGHHFLRVSKTVRAGLEDVVSSIDHLNKTHHLGHSVAIVRGQLSDFCNIVKGTFPTKKTPPGDYKFVVLAAEPRTSDSYQIDGEAVCIPLISSTGHGHAAIHRIHYVAGKFALANILVALIIKKEVKLLPKYLYYYLWKFKDEKLVKLMSGTANTSLTVEKLGAVEIEFPPFEIQQKIVNSIDQLVASLDKVKQSAIFLIDYGKTAFDSSLIKILTVR